MSERNDARDHLMHARSHKYIRKYVNKNGKTTYVYGPGGVYAVDPSGDGETGHMYNMNTGQHYNVHVDQTGRYTAARESIWEKRERVQKTHSSRGNGSRNNSPIKQFVKSATGSIRSGLSWVDKNFGSGRGTSPVNNFVSGATASMNRGLKWINKAFGITTRGKK